jgi:YaiO family outer membrane protein
MSISLQTVARCAVLLAAAALAWPQSPASPEPTPDAPTAPTSPPSQATSPASGSPSFTAEIGESYGVLNHGAAPWSEQSIKIGYTGAKRFAPFVTLSSQDRGAGTQQAYGAYSYVTLSKHVWAIVGAGGAPERSAILYPLLRVGGSLFVHAFPRLPGLNLSVGYSDIIMPGGSGGQIASVGAIYYGKVILSGGVNFNQSRPGGLNSESAQAGFQFGRQGRYWLGGGASGGDAAYQLVGLVPFNVHINSVSANLFYQRWLTRKFGVICRYDYLDELNFFRKNGAYIATFFEF